MTENEAKGMLQAKLTCMELELLSSIEKGCDNDCDACVYCYAQGTVGEHKKAVEMAIQALEEIQQYRAIGTIEEFKAYKLGECMKNCGHYENCSNYIYSKGYDKAIDDVVCKISDYKEKHYHNREEYPINYGLLCDMENWFLDMKGE